MKIKFFVKTLCNWDNHNSGWNYVSENLLNSIHDNNSSLIFYTNGVETEFIESNKEIKNNWIGILHLVPGKEINYLIKTNKTWLNSLNNCKGLFCLSNYVSEHIKNLTGNKIKVETLYHPTAPATQNFDWNKYCKNKNKNILFIGKWLRNINFFEKLNLKLPKIVLGENLNDVKNENNITFLPRLSSVEYDEILSKNIVFLNLYNSSANNIVLECIERKTPLIINRLPALEEYLGKNYLGFYETIEEAKNKINCKKTIYFIHEYLKKLPCSFLKIENFINSIYFSNIVKSLKPKVKLL